MTKFTEGVHAAGFLVSESNKTRSREQITVLSGEVLQAGAVLGKLTASGKYVGLAAAGGTDDSDTVAGILWDNVDATDGDIEATAIVRDAEVNENELVFADELDTGERAAALVGLRALGIIPRP
jgi:hypothetical protein